MNTEGFPLNFPALFPGRFFGCVQPRIMRRLLCVTCLVLFVSSLHINPDSLGGVHVTLLSAPHTQNTQTGNAHSTQTFPSRLKAIC